MSEREPRRLLELGHDELHPKLRALLVAGRDELPSAEQLARMAHRAGAQLSAPQAHAGAATSGVWPVVKLGALLALLASAGWFAAQPAREPSHAPRTNSAPAKVARSSAPAALTSVEPVQAKTPAAPVPQPAPSTQRALRMTLSRRSPSQTRDPIAELALLDAAQHALRDEPEQALARAEEHAARYPHGEFEQEREVLAIEALLRMGHDDAAAQRARRFIARYPESSYRVRVEQQLQRAAGVGASPASR